jgi:hypothetical protein
MAASNLTAERLRELLDYNQDSGIFTWKVDRKCGTRSGGQSMRLAGKVAGSVNKVLGYVIVGIDRTTYLAHRLAWLHVHGKWPERQIDHIDGDRANNRLANLRDVTARVNAENKRDSLSSKQTPAPIGAFWRKIPKRWAAGIQVHGRYVHLGHFDSAEQAHEAYLLAKRRLHEGCTI